ncbi:hypothetical protein GUJ93_ZPchr0006g44543 [Zizania palustris]|uniref:Uncharacterized protein n=1 Tax=Zizania palustris TaxID=103762 RepID=A0A8J5W389_ZIZPA|nr:hypothetical protein GUJ93_ZPchr0006g44543 [Zizania palustris]
MLARTRIVKSHKILSNLIKITKNTQELYTIELCPGLCFSAICCLVCYKILAQPCVIVSSFSSCLVQSHSSLTDDEYRDTHSFNNRRNQMGIQDCPVGNEDENILYDVMRKEVRQAVEEIRTQLEKVVIKPEPSEKVTSADAQPTQVISELRRSYTSKLEESEKRKQELLAQLAAEEQRGHELTKIVRELLPNAKKNVNSERQPRYRRVSLLDCTVDSSFCYRESANSNLHAYIFQRSNDRVNMSRRLTEEAEQYFEDFLSNVEDTDFSSFDGERSDTSSSRRDVVLNSKIETPTALPKVASPVESDGVVLPWLQWETSNDLQTSPSKTKTQGASAGCSTSSQTMSSRGSWSPGDHDSAVGSRDRLLTSFDDAGTRRSSCPGNNTQTSSFHIDDYMHLRRSHDLLLERWRQKQRIEDGGLILCGRSTTM